MYNFNHPHGFGKMIVSFILLAIIYLLAFYSLWNWLIPKIFGLPVITIWEATGLLALFKIVFGFNIKKKPHHSCNHESWKNHLKQKMEGMTEEEKEEFKRKFKDRCFKK